MFTDLYEEAKKPTMPANLNLVRVAPTANPLNTIAPPVADTPPLVYLARTRRTVDEYYGIEEFFEIGRYYSLGQAVSAARDYPNLLEPHLLGHYREYGNWRTEIIIEGWNA